MVSDLPDDFYLAVKAKILKTSFSKYIRAAWKHCTGFEFIENPHIDILAKHCEAIYRGDIQRCLWNLPPSCSKSTVLVLFESWCYANDPTFEILCVSYSMDLALRDSVRCRELLRSEWYTSLFPNVVISSDEDSKSFFRLTAGGSRRVSSPDAMMTGLHYDLFVGDDLQSVSQVNSYADREKLKSYYWESVSTRGIASNRKGGARHLIAQQRLGVDDLSSSIINRHEELIRNYGPDASPWYLVNLPMRYDPERAMVNRGYGHDWRTTEGELLYPALLPEAKVVALERELGPKAAQAQLQQNPRRSDANMVQVSKIKIIEPSALPLRFDSLVRFWDLAGTDGSGCFSVGLLLGRHDDRFFLLDVCRGQWELSATIDMMKMMAYRDESQYGNAVRLGWEEQAAAAGKFLTTEIQKRLREFRTFSVRPTGSKELRMEPVAASISYGEFHALNATWLPVLLDELEQFPHSKFLDQGDALSGAYQSLVSTKSTSGSGMALPTIQAVRDPSTWETPKCANPECRRPAFGLQDAKSYCCGCCEESHGWEEECLKHSPECNLQFTEWWNRNSPNNEPTRALSSRRTSSVFKFKRGF